MSDKVEKKYVYIPVDIARQIEEMEDVGRMAEVVRGYYADSDGVLKEYLNDLDEQVVIYKGLMLKATHAFRTESLNQIEKADKIWNTIDALRPSINNKIKGIVSDLAPLSTELERLNRILNGINLSSLERLLSIVQELSYTDENTKGLLHFLLENFSKEDEDDS